MSGSLAAANILALTEFLAHKPADLSDSQRQRVALGQAMVRDAPIFLIDERFPIWRTIAPDRYYDL